MVDAHSTEQVGGVSPAGREEPAAGVLAPQGSVLTITAVPDEPEPRPETTWLLVEVRRDCVNDAVDGINDNVPGVQSVYPHPADCCCKNCPWKGDHGSGHRHGDEE